MPPTGIKVDDRGNLYVSGPGGLWIISPEGKHLGTIIPPKHPHNLTRGGDDGKTTCITARGSIIGCHSTFRESGPLMDIKRLAAQADRAN